MESKPQKRSRAARLPMRTKLIFNPNSGSPDDSPHQLMEIIQHLQSWNFHPEVYLMEPDCDLQAISSQAVQEGFPMVVVCGGDGTIDSVANGLVDSETVLGIIPTGTQNNVALSLGISSVIADSVALLRNGRRLKLDVGCVSLAGQERWFLEAVTLGLPSALFPSADDIQKGNLARLGEFLSTLVSFPPARMRMKLDGSRRLEVEGHMALVANMPYIGAHFQLAQNISYSDNRLDLLVFSNLSKLDLMGYAMQLASGAPEDERIQHFRVRSVEIESDPAMPVMADGFAVGEGPVSISTHRRSLTVMAGGLLPAEPAPDSELLLEASPNE